MLLTTFFLSTPRAVLWGCFTRGKQVTQPQCRNDNRREQQQANGAEEAGLVVPIVGCERHAARLSVVR